MDFLKEHRSTVFWLFCSWRKKLNLGSECSCLALFFCCSFLKFLFWELIDVCIAISSLQWGPWSCWPCVLVQMMSFKTSSEKFFSGSQLIMKDSSQVMFLWEMRCHLHSGIVACPSLFMPHKPPGNDDLLSSSSNQKLRDACLSSPRVMGQRFEPWAEWPQCSSSLWLCLPSGGFFSSWVNKAADRLLLIYVRASRRAYESKLN